MSIEKVRAYFASYGMEDRILEFPVSSATVELAAQALGCEGKRIVKSLAFGVDGQAILICAAGGCQGGQRQIQGPVRRQGEDALP